MAKHEKNGKKKKRDETTGNIRKGAGLLHWVCTMVGGFLQRGPAQDSIIKLLFNP